MSPPTRSSQVPRPRRCWGSSAARSKARPRAGSTCCIRSIANADQTIRPTVMVVDLDRFKQVNDSVGIAVGDSILLTLARRLGRLLKPQDTIARLAGDQFALIVLSEKDPDRVLAFTETLRR